MVKHKIIILLLGVFLFPKLKAQIGTNYSFKFKNYTTQNGLSHNYTRKCLKDSKGFLWIITQNGLNRFDGVTFTTFLNEINDSTSLPANDLLDMAIDKNDNIWLAYGKGICCYNQKTHSFIKPKTTLNIHAQSLAYDESTNTIWYNTANGLFKINAHTLLVEKSSLQTTYPNFETMMYIDSKHRLWIGIERFGFYVYNIQQHTFQYFDKQIWPRRFYEDDEHNVWIASWGSNIIKFDSTNNPKPFWQQQTITQEKNIYAGVTQSKQLTGSNILWTTSLGSGIVLYDKKLQKPVQEIRYDASVKSGLLSDFSANIYCDNEGIIWVCSWRGLSKINKQEQQFQSTELSFLKWDHYNLISGIADDPYNASLCWITVEGSGVAKYDKINQKVIQWYHHNFEKTDEDKNYRWRWTKALYKGSNNVFWITTDHGLIKINNQKIDTIPINFKGNAVFIFTGKMVLKNNNWWIFSKQGLIQFNTTNNQYQFYNDSIGVAGNEKIKRINDGCFINDNEILCATSVGIFIFNIATKQFAETSVIIDKKVYGTKKFLVVEKINNSVFIGGEDGLIEYNITTKTFTAKGLQLEISKLSFNTLKKDANNKLWIYSPHSLLRYDPEKDAFKKFTTADGIYDNSLDPVQLFDYNNDFYIGYRMACTRFNPLQVDVNNNKPKPFITELKINNQLQKLAVDDYKNITLNLRYTQNNISFDFTAIDYTSSEKITFAHQLEGIDNDWILDGTKRTVAYSNLAGGHYKFKVKSCNSSGLWNDEEATMMLYIQPPFWQTWWFKTGVVLLFVFGVMYFAFSRIRKIRKEEKDKTAVNKMMAEMEMKALRSQMNPHFIFNSLNSIQKYIWANKQEDASEYLTKFARLMRIILSNSMHKLVSLEDEVISLQLYVELEHRRCNNKFDYTINIEKNIELTEILVPPMLLQPYIENAIWHGLLQKEGRGILQINVAKPNEKILICTIEDSGIGRKKAAELKSRKGHTPISYGMAITEQRLTMTEVDGRVGNITIEDLYDNEVASGTKIIIEIPIESFKKIRNA